MITPLQYLLTLAIVFSGLVGGVILSFIAPEELLPGRRYFRIGEYGVLISLLIILLIFLPWYWGFFVVLILFSYCVLFKDEEMILSRFYIITPIIIYIVITNNTFYLWCVSVLFLWGLFRATRDLIPFVKNEKLKLKKEPLLLIAKKYLFYWAVGLVLYIVMQR